MKKKNIFILAFAFVMGAIVSVPVFAQESDTLTEKQIADSFGLKTEYPALDYLSAEEITYYEPVAPLAFDPDYNCSVNKDLDYEKIQKKLKSKRKPNICMQFDIMSYLLSKKDYDSLQQALNIGYNPRIEIETNKERKTLLDQSVISNDKKALTMFYNKIKTNGLSVYKNVGSETIEEVLQIELANTLGRLIHDTSMKDMDKIKLIKLLEERSRIVREALQNLGVVINSEHLKNAVVKNDAIVFRVAYHLIPEAPEAKRTEIALDALYKLIDYRIQQGS